MKRSSFLRACMRFFGRLARPLAQELRVFLSPNGSGTHPYVRVARPPLFARSSVALESLPFATEVLRGARVCIFGASGLGSPIIESLVRAGVGEVHFVDPKHVRLCNLSRTRLSKRHVRPRTKKVYGLARGLPRDCASRSTLIAWPCTLEQLLNSGKLAAADIDLLIVATDNDASRLTAQEWCLDEGGIPFVTCGVSADEERPNEGMSFLWKPGLGEGVSCFGCYAASLPASSYDSTGCGDENGPPANPMLCELTAATATSHAVALLLGETPAYQLVFTGTDAPGFGVKRVCAPRPECSCIEFAEVKPGLHGPEFEPLEQPTPNTDGPEEPPESPDGGAAFSPL